MPNMRARAIQDLAQLSDDALFSEVAVGMGLCLENAERLFHQSEELGKLRHSQGYSILRGIAEEEAGKFLILLDAVRCPKSELTKHLKKFNSHLARCLYAESCNLRPADYKELMHCLNLKRHSLYLDGPNAVEFIMRNEIFQERESAIYVDYIENETEHAWLNPDHWCFPIKEDWDLRMKPRIFEVANALKTLGIVNGPSLKIIAERWRPISIHSDYSWANHCQKIKDVFAELDKKKLLTVPSGFDFHVLFDSWQFPLYAEPLQNEIDVNRGDLEERRDNWRPDYY